MIRRMKRKVCKAFTKKLVKRRIVKELYDRMEKAIEMGDIEYVTILGTKAQKVMKL